MALKPGEDLGTLGFILAAAEGALDSESQDEAVLRDQDQDQAECVSLSWVVRRAFAPAGSLEHAPHTF